MDRLKVSNQVDTTHGVILYLEDVSVSFDGFKALDRLDLYINEGELRSVIGPNGAGKTTMMDVISGKTRPEQGRVYFGQRIELTQLSENEIAHIGIGRKFQKPTVFLEHTAFENLELAMHHDKGVWTSLYAKLTAEQCERIDNVLETIGLQEQKNRQGGIAFPWSKTVAGNWHASDAGPTIVVGG
jgi:urea transport system ATP-binding protein